MNLPTNTLKQQGHIFTQNISVCSIITILENLRNKEVYDKVLCQFLAPFILFTIISNYFAKIS